MLGNIFILGDSYSTFEGYIPEGFATYYLNSGPHYLVAHPDEAQPTERDVHTVEQTWWYPLANEHGKLILNCSWSGTTICNTGYDGCDNSDKSFIARLEKLINEGFFEKNKVDTLFLFGGTNDSWSNAPLGEKKDSDITKDDLYCVFPAFSYIIDLLVRKLTDVKVYCIINTDLKSEIDEYYKSVCKKHGVDTIILHDIDKICGHPSIKGMTEIKNQIVDFVKSKA